MATQAPPSKVRSRSRSNRQERASVFSFFDFFSKKSDQTATAALERSASGSSSRRTRKESKSHHRDRSRSRSRSRKHSRSRSRNKSANNINSSYNYNNINHSNNNNRNNSGRKQHLHSASYDVGNSVASQSGATSGVSSNRADHNRLYSTDIQIIGSSDTTHSPNSPNNLSITNLSPLYRHSTNTININPDRNQSRSQIKFKNTNINNKHQRFQSNMSQDSEDELNDMVNDLLAEISENENENEPSPILPPENEYYHTPQPPTSSANEDNPRPSRLSRASRASRVQASTSVNAARISVASNDSSNEPTEPAGNLVALANLANATPQYELAPIDDTPLHSPDAAQLTDGTDGAASALPPNTPDPNASPGADNLANNASSASSASSASNASIEMNVSNVGQTREPTFEDILQLSGYSKYRTELEALGVKTIAQLFEFVSKYLPSQQITPMTSITSITPTASPLAVAVTSNLSIPSQPLEQKKFRLAAEAADDEDDKPIPHSSTGIEATILPNPNDKNADAPEPVPLIPDQAGDMLADPLTLRTQNYEDFRERPDWVDTAEDIHVHRDKMSTVTKRRNKLALYEADEQLDDETICDYALLVRHAGETHINGYYTVVGRKNGRFLFTHQKDPKAAIFREKNGTWMVVYDNELLYSNPLKADAHGGYNILNIVEKDQYPPPLRCWNSVSGKNPPPGCMWVEMTVDPLVSLDEEQKQYYAQKKFEEEALAEFEQDLPVQMIDFMFCGPLGFALRIDEDTNLMEVIRIKPDGQAAELGLKNGDMLLRINEEDVSRSPDVAFPLLKECVQSQEAFEVTFLRKCFDKLVITVTRGGTVEVNGKYQFWALDEADAPVFVKEQSESWALVRLDYDDQTGESIWALQKDGQDVYVGLSKDYSPPNGGWEEVNDGLKPAPGLSYFVKDSQAVKKWIPDEQRDELKKHNMLIQGRKRKNKNIPDNMDAPNSEAGDDADDADEDNASGVDPSLIPARNTLSAMIAAHVSPKQSPRQSPRHPTMPNMALTPLNMPAGLGHKETSAGSNSSASELHGRLGGVRSASVMSDGSAMMSEEVQQELEAFQEQITSLQDQLKFERDRKHTIQESFGAKMTEMEKKIQEEEQELENAAAQVEDYKKRLEFMKNQLSDANYYYYDLWMLQWDKHQEVEGLKHDMKQTKSKWNLAKKQLFQAQRKIDDLQEEMREQQEMYEMQINDLKEEVGQNKDGNDSGQKKEKVGEMSFAGLLESENESADKDFQLLEMQTELIDLKAKLASKDVEVQDLKIESAKWQDAHDTIFEQMSQAHKRLSDETAEFESAKRFYQRKLDRMRDIIQDNEVEMFEFERRIGDLEKEFKEKTGEDPTDWQRPKRRRSMRMSASQSRLSKSRRRVTSAKHAARESTASLGSDFGEAGMEFNTHDDKNIGFRRQSNTTNRMLNDLVAFNNTTHYDDDLFEDEDADGAFGAFGTYDTPVVKDDEETETTANPAFPKAALVSSNSNKSIHSNGSNSDNENEKSKTNRDVSVRFSKDAGAGYTPVPETPAVENPFQREMEALDETSEIDAIDPKDGKRGQSDEESVTNDAATGGKQYKINIISTDS